MTMSPCLQMGYREIMIVKACPEGLMRNIQHRIMSGLPTSV